MFDTSIHFQPSLIFLGKTGAYQNGALAGFHCNRFIALPTNIRLGWKWTKFVKTLANYDTATITTVTSFIVQASGAQSSSWLYLQLRDKFFKTSQRLLSSELFLRNISDKDEIFIGLKPCWLSGRGTTYISSCFLKKICT